MKGSIRSTVRFEGENPVPVLPDSAEIFRGSRCARREAWRPCRPGGNGDIPRRSPRCSASGRGVRVQARRDTVKTRRILEQELRKHTSPDRSHSPSGASSRGGWKIEAKTRPTGRCRQRIDLVFMPGSGTFSAHSTRRLPSSNAFWQSCGNTVS